MPLKGRKDAKDANFPFPLHFLSLSLFLSFFKKKRKVAPLASKVGSLPATQWFGRGRNAGSESFSLRPRGYLRPFATLSQPGLGLS
jgi:hypothetical protein